MIHHEILVNDCGIGKAEEINAEKCRSAHTGKAHLHMNMHTVKRTQNLLPVGNSTVMAVSLSTNIRTVFPSCQKRDKVFIIISKTDLGNLMLEHEIQISLHF